MSNINRKHLPVYDGALRRFSLKVPPIIRECSGIVVFGRRIKSVVFTTDLCVVRNIDADAILAVYPFTPQPIITQALMLAADTPVFAGIGGGLTTGDRVVHLASNAEMQGATGVVMNAPTDNETLYRVSQIVEIPSIITIVNDQDDYLARVNAGASIFNVAAAIQTPSIVRSIRRVLPNFPIIATGGPTDDTILATIEAGANAISYTPPATSDLFKQSMSAYRENRPHHE